MNNQNPEAVILALDDNEIILKLIVEILKEKNYRIYPVTRYEEALTIFKNEKIDLVLLDVRIDSSEQINSENTGNGELNGYDVLKKLRELDISGNVPVIFLTSLSDTENKVEAFKAGAADFITKPFNSEELIARIETQIRLKRTREEISNHSNDLEKIVAEKTRQLEEYAKNLEQMVEEKVGIIKMNNELMQKDLESARRMQRALMPKKTPSIKKIKVDTHYQSCDKLGGDFYDIFNLDENHVGFYAADVSGHGVSAAMITFFIKELIDSLKKTIFMDGKYEFTPPAIMLEKINLKILEEDFDGLYITMFYAILNTQTGELIWSNAGHIAYPVIYRNIDRNVEILHSKSMALGWFDYARFKNETVIIKPGDKIIIYSDGISDSKNENGELFGVDRFADIIKANGKKPLSTLAFRIFKEIKKFQRGKQLEDDITLFLMEYL